jgi:hypothetical protein
VKILAKLHVSSAKDTKEKADRSTVANPERQTPNAERQTPNAKRRTPNAKRQTPNAERHCGLAQMQ